MSEIVDATGGSTRFYPTHEDQTTFYQYWKKKSRSLQTSHSSTSTNYLGASCGCSNLSADTQTSLSLTTSSRDMKLFLSQLRDVQS